MMLQLQSLLGIAAILAFAWLISENRRAVSWKHVGIGLALSIALAALFLKLPPLRALFAAANSAVVAIGEPRAPARRSCSATSAAAPCPSS